MSWKRPNVKSRLSPLVIISKDISDSGVWIDLGTGEGVFAQLVKELRPNATIIGIDKAEIRSFGELNIRMRVESLGFRRNSIAGFIAAQVLHYLEPEVLNHVISQISNLLIDLGNLLVIEYDMRRKLSWVPYPISSKYWTRLTAESELWSQTRSNYVVDGVRSKYSVLMTKLAKANRR